MKIIDKVALYVKVCAEIKYYDVKEIKHLLGLELLKKMNLNKLLKNI